MTSVGVTGHQRLGQVVETYVITEAGRLLDNTDKPIGVICSLANGADQLVATLALQRGAELTVVVPAQDYEGSFEGGAARRYRKLLARASHVIELPFMQPDEEAYLAAGAEVVARCDVLFAIWDGQEARGLGGTGDVVKIARRSGVPVEVIWPKGVPRPD